MTKGDFLAAYNIGHRDGKEDVYCPNDYDDIFSIKQQSCENCCNGNQEEKAKLCQKSYIAGMEHTCENEEIIKVSKGALKARQGRFVIYDVEWLKTHFNTTEAKMYGQPSEDWNAVLDELNRIGRNAFKDDTDYDNLFDFISNLPNVKPQPSEDCISRKDIGLTNLEILMCNGDYKEALKMLLDKIEKAPSVTPQPKEEPQQKTGHWIKHKHNGKPYFKCSECLYFAPIGYSYCPGCGAKMQEVQQ